MGEAGWKGAGMKLQKSRQRNTACQSYEDRGRLDVGLGLAKTGDAITGFPLATLPEQVNALEALEDVAFNDEAVGALETFVL
jgi:hypothetical protein